MQTRYMEQVDKIRETSGYRIYWKVITHINGHKDLRSPLFPHTWRPGWNKSDRLSIELSSSFESRYNQAEKGIHVFSNREAARGFAHVMKYHPSFSDRIIRVRCYNKDIIIVNGDNAAFMKVFLTRNEYQNAMQRARIERR